VTDPDVVEDAVAADCRRYGVRALGYDKQFAWQMALHLQGAGLFCVEVPQGFALNAEIGKLTELVESEQLMTGDDQILAVDGGQHRAARAATRKCGSTSSSRGTRLTAFRRWSRP
jgi:phage terminase large subunit-like protein